VTGNFNLFCNANLKIRYSLKCPVSGHGVKWLDERFVNCFLEVVSSWPPVPNTPVGLFQSFGGWLLPPTKLKTRLCCWLPSADSEATVLV
jgi:hypothetical protein